MSTSIPAQSFVSGSYARYKSGTRKIFDWLYRNAEKCGYTPVEKNEDIVAAEESEPNGAKKAKKENKRKTTTKNGQRDISSSSHEPVALAYMNFGVKEFIALAEAIAGSQNPKIAVPLWVTCLIKEVIKGRKKSARFFSQLPGDAWSTDFAESNATHQYFIEILESVLRILGGPGTGITPDFPKAENKDDAAAKAANLFELLEIEPDTEKTMTEPPDMHPLRKVVYKEDPSSEELVWLLYCFFEDFNVAREHIKDLWTGYKHGQLDLLPIAVATNAAFEIFQRSAQELLDELKLVIPDDLAEQFKGKEGHILQKFMYIRAAQDRGLNHHDKICPDDPYNFHLFDIADWLCLPVYQILSSFLPVIQQSRIPICKPEFFGKLDLVEHALDPREKFNQDKIVLLERLLPEFMFYSRLLDPRTKKPVHVLGEDSLTKGVVQMVHTKEISIWLVLALQVQLDIHYMLLGTTSRPFIELTVAATRSVDTIQEFLDFSKDTYLSAWPEMNNEVLRHMIFEYKMWILQDFLHPIRQEYYKQAGMIMGKEKSFVLLKRHPVLCGMMLFQLRIQMQKLGVTVANAWGALPALLHLYNAAQSEGFLRSPWMDLECTILANTPKRIFIGARPDKAQEYLKRFVLVMGWSVSAFAPNQRNNKAPLQPSRRGPRKMLTESILADLFQSPSTEKEYKDYQIARVFTLSRAAIEKILGRSDKYSLPAEEQRRREASDKNDTAPQIGPRRAAKQQNLANNFTAIQLVKALESCIREETFPLNVNYFALHMRAYRFLRMMAQELEPVLIKCFGPGYLERESQLPFLVGYIFQAVASADQAQEELAHSSGLAVQSRLLKTAALLMEELVAREGSAEVDKVKKESRTFGGIEIFVRHV
ncbi:hypothetical protein F5884DRAFT_448221 [Xylogone sp. PMI_703]|nr:hypothetical protein F5884DRAFT_448221 [Xylogone sp. PMI_703]